MQAPQFCAEIFGDIARSEGTILAKLGAPCAEQAGEAVGNLFDTLGKIATVAPLVSGLAGTAANSAANWKSVKQFGHTFNEHGAGVKNTQRLLDRARGTGNPQGQWLNNEMAAAFLSDIKVDGPASIPIPQGLGQVIKPDGTIAGAGWATIVPWSNGFRTAYPILGL
jgi:hypothetical protein